MSSMQTELNMREWLSGGASPCQGEGRGFDPRLALVKKRYQKVSFFCFQEIIVRAILIKNNYVGKENGT